jgi:hypothetical protein
MKDEKEVSMTALCRSAVSLCGGNPFLSDLPAGLHLVEARITVSSYTSYLRLRFRAHGEVFPIPAFLLSRSDGINEPQPRPGVGGPQRYLAASCRRRHHADRHALYQHPATTA